MGQDTKNSSTADPGPHAVQIIDREVRGKSREASDLYDVVFKLDRSPEPAWIAIFDELQSGSGPTRLHESQRLKASGSQILWKADEMQIRGDTSWIAESVEKANERFLEKKEQELAAKEAEGKRRDAERQKIAELNEALRAPKPRV
jgi:hypothetical protein